MLKKFVAVFALLFSIAALTGCTPTKTDTTPKTGMVIESAYVTATDDAGTSFVYAKITNYLNATVTLTGGSTDDGSEALVTKDGMDSQITIKEGVDIHVNQTLELKDSGKHLTLSKLTKPIAHGDKVLFTFKFNGAQAQTVVLTAK